METNHRIKIALYGGTFDPFHKGHLDLLTNVYDELHPDRICIMPAGHPYLKEKMGIKITDAEDRIGMIRAGLSVVDFEWEISRYEVDKDGASYSVDTVDYIRGVSGDPDKTDIYFLCGSDILFSIDKWYEYKRLISGIILVVVPRGEDSTDSINRRKRELEERDGARIIISKFRGEEISSSYIRENPGKCGHMIPDGTLRYIREKHLYET